MAHEKNHDYHILAPSLYPLIGAVAAFVMFFGAVQWMHGSGPWVFLIGLAAIFYTMFGWWSETVKENNAGDHTPVVQIGLRYGVILFIMSEVMFFSAWFWTFFKHAIYPMGPMSPMQDAVWPPAGIETFDAFDLPLLNTMILLLSGCTVTWAHHALLHGNRKDFIQGLALTVILGAFFSILQAYEYAHAAFGFREGIYPSTFYMATGFHGFHVLIGTIFLCVCLFRAKAGHFTEKQHFGFEAAAWYWHFVDVVWLFLFAAVYVWGG